MSETLCWHCSRVGNGCRKPVDGWNAIYRPINDSPSWLVIECPEFKPSRPTNNGEKMKMDRIAAYKEQAKKNGISGSVFMNRVYNGWSIEDAMIIPAKRKSIEPITYKGETKTLAEWSAITGINKYTLASRRKQGWPPEKIIETPARESKSFTATNLDTGEIRHFSCVADAVKEGFVKKYIYQCLDGRKKTYKGWTFKEDKP